MADGWKRGGLIRGDGLPAPSGQYRVGCVDLMQDLAEDHRQGGLLVRLHYPTSASGSGASGSYNYAPWYPHKEYIKGYLDFDNMKFCGVLSNVISMMMGIKPLTSFAQLSRLCKIPDMGSIWNKCIAIYLGYY